MPPSVPPGYPLDSIEIGKGGIIPMNSETHRKNFYVPDSWDRKNEDDYFIFTDANPDSNYASNTDLSGKPEVVVNFDGEIEHNVVNY